MDRIDEDHKLVLNSLREAGVPVSDIYEFVNGTTPHEAIPVLVQLLPLLDNNAVKEGVIRALGDRSAKGIAASPLLAELRKIGATKPLLAWTIANSVAEIVQAGDFDEILAVAHDASLGKAREMLVVALGRTKHPDAASELMKLSDDEALAGHIVIAAGELGARQLRPFVEKQLSNEKPWVRKEAKKVLRHL
jgi:hypothetical protein